MAEVIKFKSHEQKFLNRGFRMGNITISFGSYQVEKKSPAGYGKGFVVEFGLKKGNNLTVLSHLIEMRKIENRVRLSYYKRKHIMRKEDGQNYH